MLDHHGVRSAATRLSRAFQDHDVESVVLRGYDRGHVDDLVGRAEQALLGDRPDRRTSVTRELAQPIPVRLRGYDRVQVDNFLRLLAGALTNIPGGTDGPVSPR
jgi:hypothetical protein